MGYDTNGLVSLMIPIKKPWNRYIIKLLCPIVVRTLSPEGKTAIMNIPITVARKYDTALPAKLNQGSFTEYGAIIVISSGIALEKYR